MEPVTLLQAPDSHASYQLKHEGWIQGFEDFQILLKFTALSKQS